MHRKTMLSCVMLTLLLVCMGALAQEPPTSSRPAAPSAAARWTAERANAWYAQQPWLVGSNYIPTDAINQLEMWQAASFNPQQIDKELGWAESIGMNTMRVFLHDLLWQQDAAGFRSRLDQFLAIAARHRIRPVFVLFDSVWDPLPKLGPQHPPIPGVHNSGWVQSPGALALQDPQQYPRLEAYVKGVVGAFAGDPRVLAWDVWNEPDNTNDGSYNRSEVKNKKEYVAALLPQIFAWAREAKPSQPLTSGLWHGPDWSNVASMDPIPRIQLEQSDVISFHSYSWPEQFEKRIVSLKGYGRPMICTEYMARSVGSTFDSILPIAKQYRVAAINWGFVAGKTQTYLPWDSWQRPYVLSDPPVWFHEVFHQDGSPYRDQETAIIRQLTSEANKSAMHAGQ